MQGPQRDHKQLQRMKNNHKTNHIKTRKHKRTTKTDHKKQTMTTQRQNIHIKMMNERKTAKRRPELTVKYIRNILAVHC